MWQCAGMLGPTVPETYGQEPKAYIEALLDTHTKYSGVVNGPFKAELGFNASLDKVGSALHSLPNGEAKRQADMM